MKCQSKQCQVLKCTCKESLHHINRIEGQLKTLKTYIEEEQGCEKIAILTTSIAKSFDSLRTKTLKNFILNEVVRGQKLSKKELEKINQILKLYKK